MKTLVLIKLWTKWTIFLPKKIFFATKFVLLFFKPQNLEEVNPGPCYYGPVKALFKLKYKSKHFSVKLLKVVHEITVPNEKFVFRRRVAF